MFQSKRCSFSSRQKHYGANKNPYIVLNLVGTYLGTLNLNFERNMCTMVVSPLRNYGFFYN
jgi:hypothetical protein